MRHNPISSTLDIIMVILTLGLFGLAWGSVMVADLLSCLLSGLFRSRSLGGRKEIA